MENTLLQSSLKNINIFFSILRGQSYKCYGYTYIVNTLYPSHQSGGIDRPDNQSMCFEFNESLFICTNYYLSEQRKHSN